MLIEFRVKNFRSIRDEQVLSLVASKDKTLKDTNVCLTNVNSVPALLKSAAIYGRNASGKSNIIKALQCMRSIISNLEHGLNIPYFKPFLLDRDSADQPTEFETTFLLNNTRYQYGFSFNKERIISEHLLVYQLSKPQNWFERHVDAKTGRESYKFSSSFKGTKRMWAQATRPDSLFLSVATQFNSVQLSPILNWFRNNLIIFNEHSPLNANFAVESLRKQDAKKAIINFLNSADINVSDIEVVTQKIPAQDINFDMKAGKVDVSQTEKEANRILFHHRGKGMDVAFDLYDESRGTGFLFFQIAPILDILSKELILIIDEIEASLHTLLVQKLILMFHRESSKKNSAQLIFTTHSTTLLSADHLFRRDQIWFTEKVPADNNETRLYPLSDFKPRRGESLEKGYLTGRYGGLPYLEEFSG